MADLSAAWEAWYSQTYGVDYPNGTEFDSGEMFEAFAAGYAAGDAAEQQVAVKWCGICDTAGHTSDEHPATPPRRSSRA